MDISEHLLIHVQARSFGTKPEWVIALHRFDRDVVIKAHESRRRETQREAIQAGEVLEQVIGWLAYGDPILDEGFEIEQIVSHIQRSITVPA